jgi:hypothetical protein
MFEELGETRGRDQELENETKGSWRRCLLCKVEIYKVAGPHLFDYHGTRAEWVEVDLSIVFVSHFIHSQLIVSTAHHSTNC